MNLETKEYVAGYSEAHLAKICAAEFGKPELFLFKKRGKQADQPESYRPISLPSTYYKLTEKMMINHFNQ